MNSFFFFFFIDYPINIGNSKESWSETKLPVTWSLYSPIRTSPIKLPVQRADKFLVAVLTDVNS